MFSPSIPRTLINCVLAWACVLASTAVFASATVNTSYGTNGVSAPAPSPSYSVGNAVDHNDSAHGAYSLINAANTQNGNSPPGVYSIVRRTATGALDTNFGVGGVISTFPNNSGTGNYYWSTMCIDPSTHYIVVTGNDGQGHFVVERLVPQSTSATFDTTSNPSGAVPGLVVTPQLSMGGGNPHECIVAGDGTIFVAGSSGTGTNNITTAGVIVVAKINSDGSMAGTFGAGGMASIAVTDGSGNPLIPEVGGMDFNSDQSVNNDLIIAGDTYLPNTDGSTTTPLVMAVQRCDGALDTSFNSTGVYLNASFDSNAFSQSVYVRILSTGYITLLYIAGQGNPPFTSDLVTLPFPFTGSGVTTAGASTLAFPTGITPRGGVATNYDGTFVVGGNNSSTQEVLTEFTGDPSFGFTVGIPATLATCPAGTPGISASPTNLSFGNQVGGSTSAAQSITVTNTGTAALTVSGVTLTGANTPAFSIASNSCSTVGPGGTCAIGVVFHPPGTGAKSASVNIASNVSGSPTTVALSGTGVTGPGVSVSPTGLSFGTQVGGTTSGVQTITVHNTGTASLSVSGVTLTGANTPAFSIASNGCSASVAAGGSCNIGVTFNPPGTGAKSANVSIVSNAPGSPTLVGLSGTGVVAGATISATPTSWSFGSQAGGTTSAVQTITVHNTGTASLSVSGVTLTGLNTVAFSITSNGCTAAVAAGAFCNIGVTFNPPGSGAKSASLSITSNAPGSPTLVGLSGTGVAAGPAISASPTSLSFGSQAGGTTSAAQTITVHNTGTTTLSAIGWQLTGANTVAFSVVSNSCSPTPLAAGATCTFGVTFNPPGAGAKSASLSISSAAGTPTVSLSGTGT